MNLPIVTTLSSTWPNVTQWTYSPKVYAYYPKDYVWQHMFDLTHRQYLDSVYVKAWPLHLDNRLP